MQSRRRCCQAARRLSVNDEGNSRRIRQRRAQQRWLAHGAGVFVREQGAPVVSRPVHVTQDQRLSLVGLAVADVLYQLAMLARRSQTMLMLREENFPAPCGEAVEGVEYAHQH